MMGEMTRREAIDTTAVFVRDHWRGTLLPHGMQKNMWELLSMWRRVPIRVRNARLLDPPATLASHGFELVRVGGATGGRQGIDGQCEAFRAEAVKIVEALTGCGESRVINQYHRNGFLGLRPGDTHEPAALRAGAMMNTVTVGFPTREVHTDVSPWSELRPEWNEFVKERHGGVFNVWRSTDPDGPVEDMPLAVCCADSVAHRDMVATWFPGYPGGGVLDYRLTHNASQQWFYYPRMGADEALVMRLYDTREPLGGRRGVFHAAVEDPGAPSGARRRQSVDIRIAVAFEDEIEQDARRARFLAELPPVPDALRPSAGMPGA